MVDRATVHPDSELLIAYGLGKLSGDQSTEIEVHLTTCETCCQVVAAAADDPLVAQIRAQKPEVPLLSSPTQPSLEGEDHHELLLGQLGDYRLLRVLRSGGMGTVFLAEDVRLRRQVAVKIMRPEVALNPQARQRFFREARAITALEHEHIVAIFHVGEEQGTPFLVMPLLKGMSLADHLCLGRLWSLEQVLRIGQEVAQGLAAAHERGIGDNGTPLAEVDVYDPATQTWTTCAPLPTLRHRLAATVVADKLYAVGGMVRDETARDKAKHLDIVEVYDPATNCWTSMPPLPTPREDLVLVAVGRTLYAIGGSNEKGVLGTVEVLTLP
jgi:hypothetical protein